MQIDPEFSGVSVVLLGSFNPAIFTPAWFALHELLPKSAAENAELQVAHPGLTVFSTEWLQLQITTDRFQAATRSAPNIRVHDFVARVFGEHLFHTPVSALGINRYVHFRAQSQNARDRVGRMLAPVEPWRPCFENVKLDSEHIRMRSLTIGVAQPEGRPPGRSVNVTVEPSARIDDDQSGIFVGVNDHYVVGVDGIEGRRQLLTFLTDDFESSIKRSDVIIDHVMSLTKDEGVRDS